MLRWLVFAGLLSTIPTGEALAANPDGRTSLTLMVSGARVSSSETYTVNTPTVGSFDVQPRGTHGGVSASGLLTLPVLNSLSVLVRAEFQSTSPKPLVPAAGWEGQDGNGYYLHDRHSHTIAGGVGLRIFFGQ